MRVLMLCLLLLAPFSASGQEPLSRYSLFAVGKGQHKNPFKWRADLGFGKPVVIRYGFVESTGEFAGGYSSLCSKMTSIDGMLENVDVSRSAFESAVHEAFAR